MKTSDVLALLSLLVAIGVATVKPLRNAALALLDRMRVALGTPRKRYARWFIQQHAVLRNIQDGDRGWLARAAAPRGRRAEPRLSPSARAQLSYRRRARGGGAQRALEARRLVLAEDSMMLRAWHARELREARSIESGDDTNRRALLALEELSASARALEVNVSNPLVMRADFAGLTVDGVPFWDEDTSVMVALLLPILVPMAVAVHVLVPGASLVVFGAIATAACWALFWLPATMVFEKGNRI
jgi:hypothetical protein